MIVLNFQRLFKTFMELLRYADKFLVCKSQNK